jgi:hypothetical protein
MKYLSCLAFLFLSSLTSAITPPTIAPLACDTLLFSWTQPTAREDGTPLQASEIAKYVLYLTNEAAAINIVGPVTSFVYRLPAGYTVKSTDAAQISVTDTNGIESAASTAVNLPLGAACPKSRPGAPKSVTAVKK